MKNQKSILKWFVILPLIIVTVNSCKKDKKEELTPPVAIAGTITLTPEKTSVSPFEVIYFTNTGQGVLNANSYVATINGTTVTLDKINDKLWLVLPDIAPGTYALSGTVEGSSININFTVNALPVIADPNAYYNSWQTEFLAEKQTTTLLGDSIASAGLISSTAFDNDKNVITQLYDSTNYYWNQLSPQEKITAAGIVELYQPIIDGLKEINNVYYRTAPLAACDAEKTLAENNRIDYTNDDENVKAKKVAFIQDYLKCYFEQEEKQLTEFDKALQKAYYLNKTQNPIKIWVYATWAFTCKAVEEFNVAYIKKKISDAKLEYHLKPALIYLNWVIDLRETVSITHIDCTNNTAIEIMPSITFESIKESDASGSFSIPKNYAVSLSSLRNDFINSFNSMLPAPLQLIPEFSNESKTSVYNRNVSIANISNSNVTGTCQLIGDRLNLEFHSVQTTTQNFTFDLVYTNTDVGTVSTNISVTLLPTSIDILDADGNIYHSVTIGNQQWLVENLRTTHYNNGDPISNITDNNSWGSLTTGAYCNYDNNASNAITYGKLYNFYAVSDSRKIAPAGWHIATDAEWCIMENEVEAGTDPGCSATSWCGTNTGGKLKQSGTSLWQSPNTGATNTYSFNAIPGGCHGTTLPFFGIGTIGYWWSATESSATMGWYRDLSSTKAGVYRNNVTKVYGCSVRCVKD